MKKNSQIVELSTDELREEVGVQREALKKLKFNHAIAPLENPMLIRNTKKYIARLATELNKR